MATLKNIFTQVSMMNPQESVISSIGTFIDPNNQQLADYMIKEIMGYLPHESLAWKIITGTTGRFSEKQLWVIAYELQKNTEYCAQLDKTLAEIEEHENWKRAQRRAKRHQKAEAKKAVAQKVADTNVQAGDVVEHTKFGEGVVIAADEKTVTVRFNEVGEKKLLKAFAPIVKK